MDCTFVVGRPKCAGSDNGSIKLKISNISGKLFINWINVPQSAKIYDDGKTINNLSKGTYVVELEDEKYFGKNKKSITIDITEPDALQIDLVRVQQPNCVSDRGSVDIAWSGGIAPYRVNLGGKILSTNENFCSIPNLTNNTSYQLFITDANNCVINYTKPIEIIKKAIDIKLDINHIKKYGDVSARVSAIVTNAAEPIKTAWYKTNDLSNPIIVNKLTLDNLLSSGKYLFKIIDANDCVAHTMFDLPEPRPLTAKCFRYLDHSYNKFYPSSQVELIYNTLIIPIKDYPELLDIIPGDTVRLIDTKNNKKYKQSAVIHADQINNGEYYYFYIATGIRPDRIKRQFILSYKDKEYNIEIGFNKNTSNIKLCVGFLICSDDYLYKFNKNDTVEVFINEEPHKTNIVDLLNKMNMYLANTNTTLLFFDIESNLNLIKKLSKLSQYDQISIRSLDTRTNNNKGAIKLKITGGIADNLGVYNTRKDQYRYKIKCLNKANGQEKTYYTDRDIEINNLDKGEYSLVVEDIAGNNINFVNDIPIPDGYFDVEILGSADEEYAYIQDHMTNILQIPNRQPQFQKLPRFLKSQIQRNKANLLINIMPHNTTIEIFGPNNFYELFNSTYQLLSNIEPGKYTAKINNRSKDFYVVANNTYSLNSI